MTLRNSVTPADEAARQLIEQGMGYGSFVSHDKFREVLNIKAPDYGPPEVYQDYALTLLNAMDALKEELLQTHSMYLISQRGQGYLVCPPSEQTAAAWDRGMKRVASGLRHLEQGLRHINAALLDDEQRAANSDAQSRAAGLRSAVGRRDLAQRKTMKVFAKTTVLD